MKKIKVLAIIAALACLTAGCSDAPKDSSSAQKESRLQRKRSQRRLQSRGISAHWSFLTL